MFVCSPVALAAATGDTGALAAKVADDLPGPIITQHSRRRPLLDAMRVAKVPAVSIAVFVDGQLAWSHAWGVRAASGSDPVTPTTLFQAASISKPVTALGALAMLGHGGLALDRDVSRAIDGWTAGSPITLRQLLSHSAGLNVSGFTGYAAGSTVPTPLQVLRGEPPANTPRVVVEATPGVAFNYSGGGYTVAQVLIAQSARSSFADAMDMAVLKPLGMTGSSFEQPLSLERRANAASGHRDGQSLPGGGNIYPELAAAGLWTTPRELGLVAVDVQNAQRGLPSKVATASIAREMLTPQAGGYGLGFDLKTREGEPVFEHSGLNEGFEARLVASASPTGPRYVVAVMTNGQGGTLIADGVIRSVARQYGWKAFAPRVVKQATVTRATLGRLEGYYRGDEQSVGIELSGDGLHVRDDGWRPARMIPLSASRFVVDDRPGTYEFEVDSRTGSRTLIIKKSGSVVRLLRSVRLIGDPKVDTVYLRGSMNNWSTTTPFDRVSPDALSAAVALTAGRHEFKIGDATWGAVNLGAPLGTTSVAVGKVSELAPMGGNLVIDVPEAGSYRIVVTFGNDSRPTISVSRVPT